MKQVSMFYLGEGLTDKLLLTVVTDEKGKSRAYKQWSYSDEVETLEYDYLSHDQVIDLVKGELT